MKNETHKLLWNFKIQTDHLISVRRPKLPIVKQKRKKKRKGTCRIVNFAVPTDHRMKIKESEKRDKYLDLARELKKTMKHDGGDEANCDWCTRVSCQKIGKGFGRLGIKTTSRDHTYYNIIKIGQNTKKRPGVLRRLAVTQTAVRNYRLMLV